ncbi:MAG: hypothetical protein IKN65_08080 [Clostridia bacterium]|nr:hypothetical protein [Clostridia bacterium]
MKKEVSLKKVLAILVIILVCLVSIGGIYSKDKNIMKNILPEYVLGMDLDTDTLIKLEVVKDEDNSSEETGETEDSKASESENKGQAKEDIYTLDNYKKTKKIIENRLKTAGVEQYAVRLDENTGSIVLEIPKSTDTDILQNLFTVGKTEIKLVKNIVSENSDTESENDVSEVQNNDNTETVEEIIGDSNSIKKITAAIDNSYEGYGIGSVVKIDVEFNKDIINKFKELKNNGENQANNNIQILIDGNAICSMGESEFLESAVNGTLPLKFGDYTKDTDTLNKTLNSANSIKNIMENGNLPLAYSVQYSNEIHSNINQYGIISVFVVLLAVMFIYLVVKYKTKGILSELSILGLGAFLLLVIRFTKVQISIATIVAIASVLILQFIYLIKLLNNSKISSKVFNETTIEFTKMLIPAFIVSVIGAVLPALNESKIIPFGNIVEISDFGMVIFWGIVLFELFNNIISRAILTNAKNK